MLSLLESIIQLNLFSKHLFCLSGFGKISAESGSIVGAQALSNNYIRWGLRKKKNCNVRCAHVRRLQHDRPVKLKREWLEERVWIIARFTLYSSRENIIVGGETSGDGSTWLINFFRARLSYVISKINT